MRVTEASECLSYGEDIKPEAKPTHKHKAVMSSRSAYWTTIMDFYHILCM